MQYNSFGLSKRKFYPANLIYPTYISTQFQDNLLFFVRVIVCRHTCTREKLFMTNLLQYASPDVSAIKCKILRAPESKLRLHFMVQLLDNRQNAQEHRIVGPTGKS